MSVLTQRNNNQRTGVKLDELTLTIEAVRHHFHKLDEIVVDPPAEGGPDQWASQIVAQPLFVFNIPWPDGHNRNVLIVCTMHGTVYAFDAENNHRRLWARWLGQPVLDLPGFDQKDIWRTNPEWGILSTPVIDQELSRIYVVMWHVENGGTYRLYKLDLTTSNILGQVTINGSQPDQHGQPVPFSSTFQKQRPGLLLIKPTDLPDGHHANVGPEGTIYIAFGASIEQGIPYHGWVLAYDADTFNQRAAWCATPNGNGAGVWQAGTGLTTDDQGNIYLMTGNGDFDAIRSNFGESFVKLSCNDLTVLDSFTPWNWQDLNVGDKDLGSSGPVYISETNFLIGAGKTGSPPHPVTDHDHHVHGSPVYYEPLSRLYLWGENDLIKAFTIDRTTGHFSNMPVATGPKDLVAPSGMPGGMLSLTANGNSNAIIWALLPLQVGTRNEDANKQILVDGVLRAFDATTLEEIWNSDSLADHLGHFAKFAPPTIANGHVYAPTYDGKVIVYGLM